MREDGVVSSVCPEADGNLSGFVQKMRNMVHKESFGLPLTVFLLSSLAVSGPVAALAQAPVYHPASGDFAGGGGQPGWPAIGMLLSLAVTIPASRPRAAGGTALAVLLGFFLLPFGRRARIFTSRSARRFFILLLLLVGLGGAGIGCNSITLLSSPGTPLGVATLKITASAYVDNTVVSHSVYQTVNVVMPGSTTP
jgi:hypothetical protein